MILAMVFVVAEVGINHGGNLELALSHIHSAKRAGADAVKFQLFKAESLVSRREMPEAYEFFRKLALNYDEIRLLFSEAQTVGIEFFATPFDLEAVQFLDSLPVKRFKVASGDIDNLPLLRSIAERKKPILISTGMSTLEDISLAITEICRIHPCDITLLHCVSLYPTSYEEANLSRIRALKEKFGVKVGYSDHTVGINCALAAVALGAEIIEKHFAIDKSVAVPDIACSADEEELRKLKELAEEVSASLGSGETAPSEKEAKAIETARRSLYALREIEAGEMLTPDNIVPLRPVKGIPARDYYFVIGKRAKRKISSDSPIFWDDIAL